MEDFLSNLKNIQILIIIAIIASSLSNGSVQFINSSLNETVFLNDINSTSISSISIDDTARSQNITIGTISVLDSTGIPQPAEITIIGPEGKLAESIGTLTIDEVPSGSRLIINSSEKNTVLDFNLDADSLDPVILLEDFGSENPAGDYLPPCEPVKYLLVEAENLGYFQVNLTIYYSNITGNFTLFKLSETFAYNEWEGLPAVVDSTNNSISVSLNSLLIFALVKKSTASVEILGTKNASLTVDIKTYDHNKRPQKKKHGHTLPVIDMPPMGYVEIDALAEKGVGVTFKSAESTGGEIILDNYGKHNPEAIYPNRAPVRFMEIHSGNINFDTADIEINYLDEEIGNLDENKLQISHFSGGVWVNLDSAVDPANNTIRATTDSLSTFAMIYNGTSVNTRKSIYQPMETAQVVIVILESAGSPVREANIWMNVTAPNGSIEYYSTLTGSIVETPDPGVYEAAYLTGADGRYNISCTAVIEGSESSFDTYFNVQSQYDFDIIRHAQSKIDPTKHDTFDVAIDIISYTDANTISIREYVPANFKVYTDAGVVDVDSLKVLTWQRSLVNNTTSVSYSYSVPMEWPKLYQLGPVDIDYGNNTFTEARPWYVAVDPFAAAGAALFDFSISPTTTVNNTETRFTLTTKNTDSNDLVNVTINCTLPLEWTINTSSISDSGTVSGQTITWDGDISIASLTSIDRYFNATSTTAGDYNFTCNGTGNVTAKQIQNWDFSSGSGTNAEYWVESATGYAITQWDSVNESMYMHVEKSGSGPAFTGDSYCSQSFTYNGPTPPAIVNLSFDWYRDLSHIDTPTLAIGNISVKLSYPNGTVVTIWQNTSYTDQAWKMESQNIAQYFNETGDYTLTLHASMLAGSGMQLKYATIRWDNASIEITNSYANGENITVSNPISAEITDIRTNETSYSSNDMAAINVTVNNTGMGNVTGNLNVTIRYLNGTILNNTAKYLNMFIPYGQSNDTTTLWNTTTTPVGNYLAYAEFNYTNQTDVLVSTANQTPFSIAGELDVKVEANGPYNLADNITVNITGTVNVNDSSNKGVPDATVNITIYDPNNEWVNQTETITIANGNYNVSLIIPSPVIGTYTADVRANNSTQEGVGFDTFKIKQLLVTANPDKDPVAPSEIIVISGAVSDAETGNFVQSAEVTVTIYNSTGVQMDTKNTATTAGGSYTTAFIASPTEDIYHINVSAVKSGITGSVQTQFNVSMVTGMALYLTTDKAVYLLDPYLWVYEAPYAASNNVTEFEGGHGQNVTLDIMVLNQRGHLVSNATVTYTVANSSGIQISGNANETARPGFYQDIFIINETIVGANDGTIYVTATYGTVTMDDSIVFHVDRWECDSCHHEIFEGPHGGGVIGWRSVIGSSTESGGSVLYQNLINASLTHVTPSLTYTTHEGLNYQGGELASCRVCHTGPDSVKCTQCHADYLLGRHLDVFNGTAPYTSCSNATCHGHLTNLSVPGNVNNRYPNCSACHPTSYLDSSISTPEWFRDNNATRNPAIHPGGTNMNESVNCSFCHYPFHRIQDEMWTMENRNCTSCHTNADVFSNHSYDNVTCVGCHQFSEDSDRWHEWYGSTDELDYHNITEPSCLTCHLGYENHSSYKTYGVSCSQCHNSEPILSYEGSVLRSGATYVTSTSIHSIYNDTSISGSLIPLCTKCHDTGYANHSSYNTYGVYCTHCHNNATLNYISARNLLVKEGVYNTTYNTNTVIHTETNSEMIPNCTSCHGSPQYQYHLGDATRVTQGLAANCTQCHDNVALSYNGNILPAQEIYSTDSEIHTTNRSLILPNQTLTLNDNCGKCHYQMYGFMSYSEHSRGKNCSLCHYGPNVEYQGVIQDKPIEHSENATGLSCTECHFSWNKMNDSIKSPSYYVNGSMFNASVHYSLNCTHCHTKYHVPPRYIWKACECCHSVQSDPVNETNRHNVTDIPSNYIFTVNGSDISVVNITSCTYCHNSTIYNNAKNTWGNNCDYCHTYPDSYYY